MVINHGNEFEPLQEALRERLAPIWRPMFYFACIVFCLLEVSAAGTFGSFLPICIPFALLGLPLYHATPLIVELSFPKNENKCILIYLNPIEKSASFSIDRIFGIFPPKRRIIGSQIEVLNQTPLFSVQICEEINYMALKCLMCGTIVQKRSPPVKCRCGNRNINSFQQVPDETNFKELKQETDSLLEALRNISGTITVRERPNVFR